uniref:Aminotransferase-like plant mobile domain-containing protein n=1 Tax=Fagus sylvatica TaxID=28930 RepID=A0A2N9G291_FAGSY
MEPRRFVMDPGPSDPSVLTRQDKHISNKIWEEGLYTLLHCRRREAVRERSGRLHARFIPYLQRAGFYGIAKLGFIKMDWALITALVERWRQETHTFHLPHGEMTITLQDVEVMLGLPVDGEVLVGSTELNWSGLCLQLLGVSPPPNKLDGSRLNMKWLQDTFAVLPDDANEVTVQQYTRAYILELLGGSYFADKSGEKVHLMFLPMLEDFDAAGRYSWGSAVLAWLYRELCRATDPDSCDIAGALILVQLWAWSRFPHISPAIKSIQPIVNAVDDANANANADDADADADVMSEVPADAAQPLPGGPYGTRWRNAKDIKDVSTHVLEQYRSDFSRQRPDQVIWEPYTDDVLSSLPEYCRIGQEVWRSVTPLICFQIVEWHLPNRALRQFGMQQDIPQPANTDVKLHDCDLRGKVHENWRQRWRHYISIWDHRREHVVTRDKMVGLMAYHDPYMDWYRRITRRFISRRSGCYEMMTLCNMRICEMFHPEQELDPAKFMELAAEAYQLAFNALEASNELHRLDSVERVNTDSDTNTHTTVPPTATRRRRPRAQRPPHPRAQRPSRPSDPSSSMSVPPIQLRDATTVTETTPMSVAHTTTPISVAQTTTPISAAHTTTPISSTNTTTPISVAHTTTPISVAHTTTPISAAHHEHTISFLTQTFSPLASFSDVTPSSPTQSVGPSSVPQSVVPTLVTQSGAPASATQLSGPAPALPQPSGPSSATQLEDLVRDIEVGDHGRGRGRGRGTKRPQPDMPVVLKRNPPRNKRKPCCGTE